MYQRQTIYLPELSFEIVLCFVEFYDQPSQYCRSHEISWMSENGRMRVSWVEKCIYWILAEHYALHHLRLRFAEKGQYSFSHAGVFVNHLRVILNSRTSRHLNVFHDDAWECAVQLV